MINTCSLVLSHNPPGRVLLLSLLRTADWGSEVLEYGQGRPGPVWHYTDKQDLLSSPLLVPLWQVATSLPSTGNRTRVFLGLWFSVISDQTRDDSGVFQKQNYCCAPGHVLEVSKHSESPFMSNLALFYASGVWLGLYLLRNCSGTDENLVLSSVGLVVPSSLAPWDFCPFWQTGPL